MVWMNPRVFVCVDRGTDDKGGRGGARPIHDHITSSPPQAFTFFWSTVAMGGRTAVTLDAAEELLEGCVVAPPTGFLGGGVLRP